MKKKKWIIAFVFLVLTILLIPIPQHLKDGGSVVYTALLYRITKVHRLSEKGGNLEGIEIEIFGKKIYSNVVEEEKTEEIFWEAITENGVDEKLLWSQIDQSTLENIARILQDTIEEEMQEERENPSLVLEEGWTRIFEKEGYRKVVEMGEKAEKPLYWIIYKSEQAGLYEYLCSQALSEIMELEMQKDSGELTWSDSKEFLEQFNQKILLERPKDFTVLNQDEKEVQLSEFYGKPMVLVFWASWCSPCREELPAVEAVYQKYQKDANFLAINMTTWGEETIETAKQFINEKQYHFPIYYDTNASAQNAYKIKFVPQIRFLDAKGNVYKSYQKVIGQEEMTKTMEQMLK